MARTTVKKNKVRSINYLNKDFDDFRSNLIEYAKTYFPSTYNDFNEASPGMMFIEMASYVGDVLSYYLDSQFRESLLPFAEEKRSIYNIAQALGYKPRVTSPSNVVLDVFQTVPALNGKPDYRYALTIKSGARITSVTNGTTFRTLDDVNFKFDTLSDPRVTTIFENDGDTPTKFLLKKRVKAESGEIAKETFEFGASQKYSQIKLENPDVIEILSCIDSDGNKWYEVDSLARDTIFEDIENNSTNDPTSVLNRDTSPYILKLKKTAKRFTTFINENDETILRFGAGVSDNPDEEIIPNPDSVGSNLPGSPSFLTQAFDPSNFLKTKTFGLAPANTTLTIEYAFGGGVDDNVNSGDITFKGGQTFEIEDQNLSSVLVDASKDSLAFSNPKPATGGGGGETVRDVRENALAYYQAQQRAVTKEDYIIRAYSLPAKFGNIAKVHLVQDDQLNKPADELDRKVTTDDVNNGLTIRQLTARVPNPLAMNMYTLGYDSNNNLAPLSTTVKENLKTYLSQYRLVTDAINIKDAYIIDVAVNFSILTKVGFNKNDILLRCIDAIKDYFDVTRWQIGQPIILSDIVYELSLVDGVSSVVNPMVDGQRGKEQIVITNKFKPSEGYSGNAFDVESATINGVIYTALDPSIFQVRFPDTDIRGTVVGDTLGITE
tara:strand:- start:2017 stop:4005 length:1989 start_codon:yes stop_codon:yes gene_type:complete